MVTDLRKKREPTKTKPLNPTEETGATSRAVMTPLMFFKNCISTYFLNPFLNAARPARPEARRSMVAGSGTGVVPV